MSAICRVGGSSSAGNLYALQADGETLLVELGIGWKDILRVLHFDLSSVTACVVTHCHADHARSIEKAVANGLDVYSCRDVADKHSGVKVLELGKKYRIGSFVVQPIAVKHSVECYSYLIEHPSMGRLLFATDLYEFPYKLRDINHFFIECNADDDIIIDRLCDNQENRSLSENHLSIDACVDALRRNVGAGTQSVTLVHLSVENSDEGAFVRRVKDEFCLDNVRAARGGMTIELNKEEF